MDNFFTRFDPSNPNKKENMSCLSLVIVSKKLEPFIETLKIDNMKVFSPISPLSKTKSVTSDHFPLIMTFAGTFCKKYAPKKTDCFTMWNTNKDGGWNHYKELTENNDKFGKACEYNIDHDKAVAQTTTEAMDEIDKVMNKIKYTAFGKVKRKINNRNNDADDETYDKTDDRRKLLENQRKEIEAELKDVDKIKHTKGKAAAIFMF